MVTGAPHGRLQRWNERFARLDPARVTAPSPWLLTALEGRRPGVALDLACGAGRHAIALAERGFRVVAVDGAAAGIERMQEGAALRGCADRIEAHVCDLERDPPEFAIAPGAYDLIADFHFLHRPLWPALRDGLAVGGRLVVALHVAAAGAAAPHAYALAPGELEATLRGLGLHVLQVSECLIPEDAHGAVAQAIAERPAGP